ncbi:membrane-associated zinc metalloprotease involved in regulating intermembrane proteolysis [Psychroflexus torquis ATCC 700755]|uniref:Zinc metalloprotease n=1 Tax=Psychroflexus torquis (strain ATCC 700755 / CIP 106069 / ACAM 623) TaxID=313595 RepID=K4IHG0_PSYTT|nr:RIP metalloprotease RseP [Psychroflexus torquis]AFU69248.1 membrane-associated zinc metalloprotease involved in regulating intermembrane proteolysis [Psychroflexus torquis ATCC 700755]
MDTFFIKAIQLLLSLSILIVLHELGHFIPAKLFKTRVEKFYLFFDVKFSLFKKKIGDTVYGIGWLPLGGYVKISGMIDESMDKEQMSKPPEPWEFRSKPTWQRLIIMLGGVTVNIVLGFLIYMMVLFVWGEDYLDPKVFDDGLESAELMKDYGFLDGDKILNVDGKPLQSQIDINRHLLLRDVNDIEVQHANGAIESLSMPEDIGQQLFQSGNFQPFSPVRKPVIDSVIPDSPAERAGLTQGILITAVNGEKVTYWHEFRKKVKATDGQAFDLSFISATGENQALNKELNAEGIGTVNITTNEEGDIGVYTSAFSQENILTKTYSFGESIPAGFDFAYWTLNDYVSQFKYVFTKKGATQVGGFGAIGSLFPDTWDWQSFWTTTAFISIILAFMNILPIPALDGGHVVFLLYEMVSGRKPNEKVMEYAQIAGFFILIALVLFANGNDVYRWITGD